MKKTVFIFFLFSFNLLFAAGDTLFFKNNFQKTTTRTDAEIYWVLDQIGETKELLVSKYKINDSLMARTFYIDFETRKKHGDELLYYEGKQVSYKKQYLNGDLHGLSTSYTYDGRLKSHTYYYKGVQVYDSTFIEGGSDTLSADLGELPAHPDCAHLKNTDERNNCTDSKIKNYIASNIIYPPKAANKGISGRIKVRYLVNEIGAIEEIEVLKSVEGGYLLENEAIRLVFNMPKLLPAMQYGSPVKAQYTVPVNFTLGDRPSSPEIDPNRNSSKEIIIRSYSKRIEFGESGARSQGVTRMPIWEGCHLKGTIDLEDDCTEWRLQQYVNKKAIYPKEMKPYKAKAICVMQFVVNKNGEVTNVEMLDENKVSKGFRDAAIAVVKSIPDFRKPAMNGKEPVPYTFAVSVKFKY